MGATSPPKMLIHVYEAKALAQVRRAVNLSLLFHKESESTALPPLLPETAAVPRPEAASPATPAELSSPTRPCQLLLGRPGAIDR